jgi:Protein of unknown function (DUF2934)
MPQPMPQVSSKSQRRNGTGVSGRIEVGPGVDEDPAVHVASPSEASVAPDEAVARRAYEKFVARGYVHGCDQEDWTQAKNEILAEMNKS